MSQNIIYKIAEGKSMTHKITSSWNYLSTVLQWFSTCGERNLPHRTKPRNGWTSPYSTARMGVKNFNWDHPLSAFKLGVSCRTSKMKIQTTKTGIVFCWIILVPVNQISFGLPKILGGPNKSSPMKIPWTCRDMSLWYAVTTCKCAISGNLLLLAATINDPWSLWWTISASLHCS